MKKQDECYICDFSCLIESELEDHILDQHISNTEDTLTIINSIDEEFNSLIQHKKEKIFNDSVSDLNEVKLDKYNTDRGSILDIDLDEIGDSILLDAESWNLVTAQSSRNNNIPKKRTTKKKAASQKEIIKTEEINKIQPPDNFDQESNSQPLPQQKKARKHYPRKRNGPIVLKDSLVVFEGFACKSCQFYATHLYLMSEHTYKKHNYPTQVLENQLVNNIEMDHSVLDESLGLFIEKIPGPELNFNMKTSNPACQERSSLIHHQEALPVWLDQHAKSANTQTMHNGSAPSQLNFEDDFSTKNDTANEGFSTNSTANDDFSINDTVSADFDFPPVMVKMDYKKSKHETTEDSVQNVNCWFCKSIFKDVDELNQHISEVHYQKNNPTPEPNGSCAPPNVVNGDLFCYVCNIQFEKRHVYTEHVVRNHAEKKFPCLQCNRSFPRPSFLNDHVRKMHLLCNLECWLCKKVMANIATLRFHLLLVHEYKLLKTDKIIFAPKRNITKQSDQETRTSTLDPNQPSTQEDQTKNVESSSQEIPRIDSEGTTPGEAGDAPSICDKCDKQFKTPRNLRKHKAAVHEEKTIMCPDCGDLFSREFLLQSHIRYTHNLKVNVACQHCNETLANEKTLYNHIRVFHKDKRYECKLCSQYFAKKEEIREHSKQFHPEVAVFKCPTCNEEFSCQSSLFIHRKQIHKLKMFSCNHCEKSFANDWQLRNHRAIVHLGQKPLYPNKSEIVCSYCQQNFSRGYHLKRHIITKHKEAHEHACINCFAKFNSAEELKQHLEASHPKINFECKPCNRQFSDRWHLNRHNASKHSDPNENKCQFCLENFASKEDLKVHLEAEHKVECKLCSKKLSSKQHLRRHLLSIHANPDERKKDPATRQECDLCNKPFFDKWSLNRHMRNVHKYKNGIDSLNSSKDGTLTPKSEIISESDGSILMDGILSAEESMLPYTNIHSAESLVISADPFITTNDDLFWSDESSSQNANTSTADGMTDSSTGHISSESKKAKCGECDKSFVTSWHLRRHINEQHSTNQKFDCTQCSSSFKHERLLRNHLSTVHAGVKHKCEQCDKEYAEKYHLKRHILSSHTDSPTFPCRDCSSIFKSSEKLISHAARHKVQSCKKCDEKVVGIQKLKMHMEEHHPEANQFKCPICAEFFESKGSLKAHQLIHHKKRLNISITDADTDDNLHKKRGTKKQKIVNVVICLECDLKFEKNFQLKAHNKEHHSLDPKSNCLICEERFPSKQKLLKHVQLNHGVNNFECKECDKAFTTQYFLKRHNEASHPKKYPCSICSVDFKSQEEHSFHMEISHDLEAAEEIDIKQEPLEKLPIFGV